MVVRLGPLDPLVRRLKPRSGGAFPLERRETNPAARRLTEWACWPTPGDGLATSLSVSAVWTCQGQQAQRFSLVKNLAPLRRGFSV